MFCRQPQIERGAVNSPSTAYLEPWKCAAIDHAIDCRGVHAQYFGNLADGQNILEFRPFNPSPVHQLTSAIQKFSQISLRGNSLEPRTVEPISVSGLSQILRGADVRPHVQLGNRSESDL
jgi:hypothetical protein